jgi:guanyl-specific ribonuclease Sa
MGKAEGEAIASELTTAESSASAAKAKAEASAAQDNPEEFQRLIEQAKRGTAHDNHKTDK